MTRPSSLCFLLLPLAVGLVSSFLSVVSFPSGSLFAVYTAYSFTVSKEECWRVVLFYSEGAQSSLIGKPLLLARACLAVVKQVVKQPGHRGDCCLVSHTAHASLARRGDCVLVSDTPLSLGRGSLC